MRAWPGFQEQPLGRSRPNAGTAAQVSCPPFVWDGARVN